MGPLVEALATPSSRISGSPSRFSATAWARRSPSNCARWLRRRRDPLPCILIASGARAPQYRRHYTPPPAPTEAEFLDELRRLEGIPREVLDDPAVLRAILPALRADAALYRNYLYSEDPPLEIPIRAYGGAEDPNVRREHLDAWQEQTTASFLVRTFAGGHFYFQACAADLRAALDRDLA